MIAVINSGPLIALAKLNRLNLLRGLFSKIYISRGVYDEVISVGLRKGISDATVAKFFIYGL